VRKIRQLPSADRSSAATFSAAHRRHQCVRDKSAAVGGLSTQLMSHAPSTVINVSAFAGNHASCTIFAGMKLNPPGASSKRLPSHANTPLPLIIVCDSFGGVPMLTHMNRLRRPNEQTGRVRFWIDMKNADLGRICTKIRQNFVPVKIGEIFELRRVYGGPGRSNGFRSLTAQQKTRRHHGCQRQFHFHK
jgi:hypothetical protein